MTGEGEKKKEKKIITADIEFIRSHQILTRRYLNSEPISILNRFTGNPETFIGPHWLVLLFVAGSMGRFKFIVKRNNTILLLWPIVHEKESYAIVKMWTG